MNKNFEERVVIQIRKKDGYSARKIAREIGCSHVTVLNELKRGKVLLYNGRIERYRAEDGQAKYEAKSGVIRGKGSVKWIV